MKYAARIFAVFLILFLISEISYQVTAGTLAKYTTEAGVPQQYLEGLDRSETRLETGAKFVFETENTELDISAYMKMASAETAGMNELEFQTYLDQYILPEEMVSLGLTNLKLKSFERHQAVIAVSYETPETMRYRYWCCVENGVIKVYDSKKTQLVLEQMFVKTKFTPTERRLLAEGVYLKDYEEMMNFLT